MSTPVFSMSGKGDTGGSAKSHITCTLAGSFVAGGCVVVAVSIKTTSVSVISFSDDTVGPTMAFSLIGAVNVSGGRIELWATSATGSNNGGTFLNIQLSGSSLASATFSHWTGALSLGASITAHNTTANPSIALTTQDANNVVVAGFLTTGATLPTALTGSLRRADSSGGTGPVVSTIADNASATPASVTVAVTRTATTWAAIALELRSVTGAPPPTGVTVTLEAQLNGVWTDITADRAHTNGAKWTITGGGAGVGPADLVANSGAFIFELDNSIHNSGVAVGYYSPNHPACRAFWGLNVPVRLSVTVGANPTYYKFAGWIDQIVPQAGIYGDLTVQVLAVDWLAKASTTLCAAVPSQLNQTGDQLLASVVGLVPIAPFATSFDVGPDTYTYGLDDLDPTYSRVLTAIGNIARSGLDRVYVKGDTVTGGVLRFESHSYRRTFITDAFVLGDTPPVGQPCLALTDLKTSRQSSTLVNDLRFTISPRRVDSVSQVLYNLIIDPTTEVAIPPAGGSVTIWATYADPNQAAQQVSGTSMVAPVATTDYLFNSAADGTATNLTTSCTVTATFFASTAKLVLTNNHATLPAFKTKLQLRGLGIYKYQSLTAEAANATSQAAFGQTLVSVDMPYQSVVGQAQAAADYLLGLYTSASYAAIPSISALCDVGDEATLWTLLQAEVSTAFSISETVSGFSGFPLWINGWQIAIDERNTFTFTFNVEPRDSSQYWSLGVAGLGELGVATFLAPF